MHKKILFGPFTQLLTMDKLPVKGALQDSQLQIIENGGILVEGPNILKVGLFDTLKAEADAFEPIEGDSVCMPGFIDAHTHICFGGSRANDFALRNAGKSYLDIAKAGGGIWDTVTKTRTASEDALINGILERCDHHIELGVTTIEVKSGYGLSVEEEFKMLNAIKKADNKCPQDLVATCLAAHMVPNDWSGTAEEYLKMIVEELFPILKSEGLSNRIDAFVEESAYSIDQIRPYFEKAKGMGFDITVHADQFTTGGSKIAIEVGAVSADHLEASTDKEIALFAHSDTIATALPGASIGLGCDFTPARKLLDAGACVAIASDHNPGSAPMGNLLAQASIMATFEKLTNAEVLSGITFRAAAALNLNDRGILKEGKQADFVVFSTDNYQDITYHQGQLRPSMIFKKGKKHG